MRIKIFIISILSFFFIASTSFAVEEKNNGFSFNVGTFDFSDDGKKSTLIGMEHQNKNLYKETKIGTISPITGFMYTADNAAYLYKGIEAKQVGKNIAVQLTLDSLGLEVRIYPNGWNVENLKESTPDSSKSRTDVLIGKELE